MWHSWGERKFNPLSGYKFWVHIVHFSWFVCFIIDVGYFIIHIKCLGRNLLFIFIVLYYLFMLFTSRKMWVGTNYQITISEVASVYFYVWKPVSKAQFLLLRAQKSCFIQSPKSNVFLDKISAHQSSPLEGWEDEFSSAYEFLKTLNIITCHWFAFFPVLGCKVIELDLVCEFDLKLIWTNLNSS
jgi:hypothetical protein